MKTQQTLLLTKDGQHLPFGNQAARDPVRKVSKSLQEKTSKYTVQDLLGLSWTLFKEDN